MKRNWMSKWFDAAFIVFMCVAMIAVVVLAVQIIIFWPPIDVTLALLMVYFFLRILFAVVRKEEAADIALGKGEDKTVRRAIIGLGVVLIIVLLGVAVGFFRLALEHSDFSVWEVAGIYLCGGLIALLLWLRRRRNNNKEKENE